MTRLWKWSGFLVLTLVLKSPAFGLTCGSSPFVVTSIADTDDGTCDADCTSREATNCANATSGATITFAIPGVGVHTIVWTSEPVQFLTPVTLDGTTQSGSSCGNLWGSVSPVYNIVFQGDNTLTDGLSVKAANVTIKGVAVTGLTGGGNPAGVRPTVMASNTIIQCTNLFGNVVGVFDSGSGTIIGGPLATQGNWIHANSGQGVFLVGATSPVVAENFIGTDVSGTSADANGSDGITVDSATTGATITHCLVSGNTRKGVQIEGTGTTVQTSFIGVDIGGTTELCNGGQLVDSGTGTTLIDNTIGACGTCCALDIPGMTCIDSVLAGEMLSSSLCAEAFGANFVCFDGTTNCLIPGNINSTCACTIPSPTSSVPTPTPAGGANSHVSALELTLLHGMWNLPEYAQACINANYNPNPNPLDACRCDLYIRRDSGVDKLAYRCPDGQEHVVTTVP